MKYKIGDDVTDVIKETKKCPVCEMGKLYISATGGLSGNFKCDKCGTVICGTMLGVDPRFEIISLDSK